jgi:hypothetical protein
VPCGAANRRASRWLPAFVAALLLTAVAAALIPHDAIEPALALRSE